MSSACQNNSGSSSSKAIPTTRRVTVNDVDHMPQDYSTTPGGTLFSTTPGGTRIIYDRKFLLECRRSPVAKTPPRCLPDIPGVTSPPSKLTLHDKTLKGEPVVNMNNNLIIAPADKSGGGDDAQFEMDI